MMKKTVLTPLKTYNVSNIRFGSVTPYPTAANGSKIDISTLNADGSVGELILVTDPVFAFGVREPYNVGSEKGYTFGVTMWGRNEKPTDDQQRCVDILNEILQAAKDALRAEAPRLKRAPHVDALKVFSIPGPKTMPGDGPIINFSMYESGYRTVKFVDGVTKEDIHYKDMIGRKCEARCAFQVEKIHVGAQIVSLMIRLRKAEVYFSDAQSCLLQSLSQVGAEEEENKEDDEENMVLGDLEFE